jgi:phosphate starvation-inducible PhoH-like protein
MQRESTVAVKMVSEKSVPQPLIMDFDDNRLLGALFGEHDQYLALLEERLGISVSSRGNRIEITGDALSQSTAKAVLDELYDMLKRGDEVGTGDVEGAIRMAGAHDSGTADVRPRVRTRKRDVLPRSPNQAAYVQALQSHDLVFGLGPAGTGKTYLAVAVAVAKLLNGEAERIILSRPAVEAGERLGFLPGDVREKVDPYLRPLYDALYDMMPADQALRRFETGEIEVAPLAFMRGRTLSNAFVILDEAQNTTPVQMKMLLTRLGENSAMAVTGDLTQVDLPRGSRSGLHEAVDVLTGVDDVAFVYFSEADIVRHPLVTKVLQAYKAHGGEPDQGGGR